MKVILHLIFNGETQDIRSINQMGVHASLNHKGSM